MKEIRDIIQAYYRATALGKMTALATVVLVEGSAYRRAGARMLITEDGELTGAISGGCLEGDALRKARLVIFQQEAMLVTYDTRDDDDAKLGVGLGCNGLIHILIEPVAGAHDHAIELLQKAVALREPAVLVTLFSLEDRKAPQPGTCLCLSGGERLSQGAAELSFLPELRSAAESVLNTLQSADYTYFDHIVYTAFVEYLQPVIQLVIAGAGNDAIPLMQIASVLGWDITVIDGRPNYALVERFPLARRVIVARPEEVLKHLAVDGRTAFVLMTHNYNYELALLRELLPLALTYIGVLGPKKKLERMLSELEAAGLVLSEVQLENVFGPVGLDIGSEVAEEIALSVVAEIKAVLSGRKGNSLKFKVNPIHA